MADEKRFTDEFECSICNNKVVMEVLHEFAIGEEDDIDDTKIARYWQITKCRACGKLLLREGWFHEIFDDSPHYNILYPPRSAEHKKIAALPKNIEKEYDAAQQVKKINSNLFAVSLGRVLDRVLIEKNARGDTLNDKLNDLAQQNLIPQAITDAAHGIRKLRNIGAHADLGELTEQEIPILEDIINIILTYLYSLPDMVAQVNQKIDALKANKEDL